MTLARDFTQSVVMSELKMKTPSCEPHSTPHLPREEAHPEWREQCGISQGTVGAWEPPNSWWISRLADFRDKLKIHSCKSKLTLEASSKYYFFSHMLLT